MVSGQYPFKGNNEFIIQHKIRNCQFKVHSYFSSSLTDLLQKILEKDPEKRLSIKQITEHWWFIENHYEEYDGFQFGRDLIEPNKYLLK